MWGILRKIPAVCDEAPTTVPFGDQEIPYTVVWEGMLLHKDNAIGLVQFVAGKQLPLKLSDTITFDTCVAIDYLKQRSFSERCRDCLAASWTDPVECVEGTYNVFVVQPYISSQVAIHALVNHLHRCNKAAVTILPSLNKRNKMENKLFLLPACEFTEELGFGNLARSSGTLYGILRIRDPTKIRYMTSKDTRNNQILPSEFVTSVSLGVGRPPIKEEQIPMVEETQSVTKTDMNHDASRQLKANYSATSTSLHQVASVSLGMGRPPIKEEQIPMAEETQSVTKTDMNHDASRQLKANYSATSTSLQQVASVSLGMGRPPIKEEQTSMAEETESVTKNDMHHDASRQLNYNATSTSSQKGYRKKYPEPNSTVDNNKIEDKETFISKAYSKTTSKRFEQKNGPEDQSYMLSALNTQLCPGPQTKYHTKRLQNKYNIKQCSVVLPKLELLLKDNAATILGVHLNLLDATKLRNLHCSSHSGTLCKSRQNAKIDYNKRNPFKEKCRLGSSQHHGCSFKSGNRESTMKATTKSCNTVSGSCQDNVCLNDDGYGNGETLVCSNAATVNNVNMIKELPDIKKTFITLPISTLPVQNIPTAIKKEAEHTDPMENAAPVKNSPTDDTVAVSDACLDRPKSNLSPDVNDSKGQDHEKATDIKGQESGVQISPKEKVEGAEMVQLTSNGSSSPQLGVSADADASVALSQNTKVSTSSNMAENHTIISNESKVDNHTLSAEKLKEPSHKEVIKECDKSTEGITKVGSVLFSKREEKCNQAVCRQSLSNDSTSETLNKNNSSGNLINRITTKSLPDVQFHADEHKSRKDVSVQIRDPLETKPSHRRQSQTERSFSSKGDKSEDGDNNSFSSYEKVSVNAEETKEELHEKGTVQKAPNTKSRLMLRGCRGSQFDFTSFQRAQKYSVNIQNESKLKSDARDPRVNRYENSKGGKRKPKETATQITDLPPKEEKLPNGQPQDSTDRKDLKAGNAHGTDRKDLKARNAHVIHPSESSTHTIPTNAISMSHTDIKKADVHSPCINSPGVEITDIASVKRFPISQIRIDEQTSTRSAKIPDREEGSKSPKSNGSLGYFDQSEFGIDSKEEEVLKNSATVHSCNVPPSLTPEDKGVGKDLSVSLKDPVQEKKEEDNAIAAPSPSQPVKEKPSMSVHPIRWETSTNENKDFTNEDQTNHQSDRVATHTTCDVGNEIHSESSRDFGVNAKGKESVQEKATASESENPVKEQRKDTSLQENDPLDVQSLKKQQNSVSVAHIKLNTNLPDIPASSPEKERHQCKGTCDIVTANIKGNGEICECNKLMDIEGQEESTEDVNKCSTSEDGHLKSSDDDDKSAPPTVDEGKKMISNLLSVLQSNIHLATSDVKYAATMQEMVNLVQKMAVYVEGGGTMPDNSPIEETMEKMKSLQNAMPSQPQQQTCSSQSLPRTEMNSTMAGIPHANPMYNTGPYDMSQYWPYPYGGSWEEYNAYLSSYAGQYVGMEQFMPYMYPHSAYDPTAMQYMYGMMPVDAYTVDTAEALNHQDEVQQGQLINQNAASLESGRNQHSESPKKIGVIPRKWSTPSSNLHEHLVMSNDQVVNFNTASPTKRTCNSQQLVHSANTDDKWLENVCQGEVSKVARKRKIPFLEHTFSPSSSSSCSASPTKRVTLPPNTPTRAAERHSTHSEDDFAHLYLESVVDGTLVSSSDYQFQKCQTILEAEMNSEGFVDPALLRAVDYLSDDGDSLPTSESPSFMANLRRKRKIRQLMRLTEKQQDVLRLYGELKEKKEKLFDQSGQVLDIQPSKEKMVSSIKYTSHSPHLMYKEKSNSNDVSVTKQQKDRTQKVFKEEGVSNQKLSYLESISVMKRSQSTASVHKTKNKYASDGYNRGDEPNIEVSVVNERALKGLACDEANNRIGSKRTTRIVESVQKNNHSDEDNKTDVTSEGGTAIFQEKKHKWYFKDDAESRLSKTAIMGTIVPSNDAEVMKEGNHPKPGKDHSYEENTTSVKSSKIQEPRDESLKTVSKPCKTKEDDTGTQKGPSIRSEIGKYSKHDKAKSSERESRSSDRSSASDKGSKREYKSESPISRSSSERKGPNFPDFGPFCGNPANVITRSLPVPLNLFGIVIGNRGRTIQKIQTETDTYIKTPDTPFKKENFLDQEYCFEISGKPSNVERAINMIRRILDVFQKMERDSSTRRGRYSPNVDCRHDAPYLSSRVEWGRILDKSENLSREAYHGLLDRYSRHSEERSPKSTSKQELSVSERGHGKATERWRSEPILHHDVRFVEIKEDQNSNTLKHDVSTTKDSNEPKQKKRELDNTDPAQDDRSTSVTEGNAKHDSLPESSEDGSYESLEDVCKHAKRCRRDDPTCNSLSLADSQVIHLQSNKNKEKESERLMKGLLSIGKRPSKQDISKVKETET
ncbi:uro-adherence factor A-like isoform X3 [Ptychodera flava]|uniref:uro-adherence factor A-like isoform X3 n=1 Tax=Ptychodera flava TaxID=63121 RepID=UPI00396A0DD2